MTTTRPGTPPARTGAAGARLEPAVLAREVAILVEAAFAEVGRLQDAAAAVLDAVASPAVGDLAALEAPVRAVLREPGGLAVGAGFVAAPGLLRDAPYWLHWWTVEAPGGEPEPLVVETDEGADAFRDYSVLPWFAVPVASGARHLTGPYVDYVCTDEYSLTLTAPVTGRHGVAGVVGLDVYVRHLERRLAPRLVLAARTADAAVALVNAQGRVVCGSSADLVTGALVRDVPMARLWAAGDDGDDGEAGDGGDGPAGLPGVRLHRCPGVPLGILVREQRAARLPRAQRRA